MKTYTIEANVGKDGANGSTTVEYAMGENIDELAKQFTPEVIYAHAKASIVVALQGFLRSKMTSTKTPVTEQKALQALTDAWKPSVRTPGKAPAEKVKETFSKMSPEERKALLAALQAEQRADPAAVAKAPVRK